MIIWTLAHQTFDPCSDAVLMYSDIRSTLVFGWLWKVFRHQFPTLCWRQISDHFFNVIPTTFKRNFKHIPTQSQPCFNIIIPTLRPNSNHFPMWNQPLYYRYPIKLYLILSIHPLKPITHYGCSLKNENIYISYMWITFWIKLPYKFCKCYITTNVLAKRSYVCILIPLLLVTNFAVCEVYWMI